MEFNRYASFALKVFLHEFTALPWTAQEVIIGLNVHHCLSQLKKQGLDVQTRLLDLIPIELKATFEAIQESHGDLLGEKSAHKAFTELAAKCIENKMLAKDYAEHHYTQLLSAEQRLKEANI